jgi:DNA helicase-2/ATP-dependent DNA helicase PcrA
MSRTYTLTPATGGAGTPAPAPATEGATIDFQAELNEQQYEAVTSVAGQALVIAGAGSGKTRTLTYRVAYLLANAIAPQNILLLTFTNKAAREMIERVNHLVPGQAAGLWSGTFHSVGNRLLRLHADRLGFSRQFSILDSDDAKQLLTTVIDQSGVARDAGGGEASAKRGRRKAADGDFPKAQALGGLLSLATNTCTPIEDVILRRFGYFEELTDKIQRVAQLYTRRKKDSNSMDFDDLLAQTVALLRDHEGLRAYYQRQFQFILVDEYQDTNALQSEMIDLLAGETGNVMVVGDDAQSIYSWRGANFENILRFPERYRDARVYKIETNYRSVPEVLALANESIAANRRQFAKNLVAARPSLGMKPALVRLDTPTMQAAFVSQRLRDLHENEGIAWKDMAVLYRAHFQSMDVQMQLTQDRVPFVITSGLRFFEQAHVKDVVAFLKWAANPRDEVSFDRAVRLLPGIGPGAAAKLWLAWIQSPAAADERPPARFSALLAPLKVPARAQAAWTQIGHVLDEFLDPESETGFRPPSALLTSVIEGFYDDYLKQSFDNARERRQDLEQLTIFSERYDDLPTMLAELALLTNADDATPRDGAGGRRAAQADTDAVALTSIHQAKGLEWKVVFLIWLTEGMFPNARVVDETGPEGLEEERRLFYVGVTRAMDQLYLCYPEFWPKAYSGDAFQIPSSFLGDFDPARVEEWTIRGF